MNNNMRNSNINANNCNNAKSTKENIAMNTVDNISILRRANVTRRASTLMALASLCALATQATMAYAGAVASENRIPRPSPINTKPAPTAPKPAPIAPKPIQSVKRILPTMPKPASSLSTPVQSIKRLAPRVNTPSPFVNRSAPSSQSSAPSSQNPGSGIPKPSPIANGQPTSSSQPLASGSQPPSSSQPPAQSGQMPPSSGQGGKTEGGQSSSGQSGASASASAGASASNIASKVEILGWTGPQGTVGLNSNATAVQVMVHNKTNSIVSNLTLTGTFQTYTAPSCTVGISASNFSLGPNELRMITMYIPNQASANNETINLFSAGFMGYISLNGTVVIQGVSFLNYPSGYGAPASL